MVHGTATLVLALTSLLAGGLTAQVKPGRSLGLKDELKGYAKILKAKDNRDGKRDREALAVMDKVMARYDKMGSKDKTLVAKALADTFRLAKRAPINPTLYERAVANLAKTGKQGGAPLRKLFTNKRIAKGKQKERKKWYPLRARILKGIGKCQDGKSDEFLLEVALRNAEDDSFLAAAGGALGEFGNASEPVRKVIAHKLIRELNRIWGLANARIARPGEDFDLMTPTFRKRYAKVRGPWNQTLQKLTFQRIKDPGEWQRFWNKNKGKRWQPASPRRRR